MPQPPFNREYKPTPGSNTQFSDQSSPGEGSLTYANPELIEVRLRSLLDKVDGFLADLNADMQRYALPADNGVDKRLKDAHALEWPRELGSPPENINYQYYKALKLRDTTTAAYITKRYEEAARDVTGTCSLDVISLLKVFRQEILLIQRFMSTTVKDFDDSSEYRSLESVQDWLQSCEGYEGQLRQVFQAGKQTSLSIPEVDAATEKQARHTQAVLKVKLNAQNAAFHRELEAFKRDFADYAEVFYEKVLKPPMDYRLNIGREMRHTKDPLQAEIESVSKGLKASMSFAIADQFRRKSSFDGYVTRLLDKLENQTHLRIAMHKLAEKGKPIPKSGPRIMVTESPPAPVVEHFSDVDDGHYVYPNPDDYVDKTDLLSPHSALHGLEQDDHPQYLMKSGGVVTGHVTLGEGATLDGIVPSLHRHTGEDGSPQIHGTDIIGGTLSDEVVDETRMPPTPTDLEFVSFRGSVNSGLLDATFAWKGDPRYTYEMQIARVEMESEEEEY